ncbi:accessory factor associated with RNA polymerase II [Ancistrocladus abbreviatus]
MDPLSALRDFTIRGELDKIVRVGDEFRFGNGYAFPCSIETAYRSKQGNLYTLESLVFYVKNHHLKHTEYMQNALRQGIAAVTLPDRRPLLDYLQGKVASSDAIEFVAPSAAPPPTRAANDVEEYRPEDPQFLSLRSSTASLANNESDQLEVDDDSGIRGSQNVDYMALIEAIEKPLRDRDSLLLCKNRDFYSVYTAAMEREEKRQRLESQQRKDGLVAKSRLMGAEERGLGGYGDELGFDSGSKPKMLKGGKIGEGVPIILVPSASHTLITIYNVKEFLEDGVFIPTDVKMKQMKGPKPECVTVQKKFSRDRDRVMMAYEVRDKPSVLKAEDWDRVVAVFVLGKEWQFKDWPFKDHVEIFNKIIGFFMRFEDDSVESAKIVKQWNVKIISISKNKRHQDRAAALEVWNKLEEFSRSRSHA